MVRHLYGRDHLDQVLATFGLILILNEGVRIVWGAAPMSVPVPDALSGSSGSSAPCITRSTGWRSSPPASPRRWASTSSSTTPGSACGCGPAPATADGGGAGHRHPRLFLVVFGLGAMLAGFAGAMVAPILSVDPGMGDSVLILTFVVIVIGGVGSVRGAFVAGLLVGLADQLGAPSGDPAAQRHGCLRRLADRARRSPRC